MRSSYGNCMTELVTEMPRSFSSAIQSEVAWRADLRDFTEPAIWIAPPNSSSFSVSVVLPASGWEMIANVRRRRISRTWSLMVGRASSRHERAAGRALYAKATEDDAPKCAEPHTEADGAHPLQTALDGHPASVTRSPAADIDLVEHGDAGTVRVDSRPTLR